MSLRAPVKAVGAVPRAVLALLALTLVLQVLWRAGAPPPRALARDLPPAPSLAASSGYWPRGSSSSTRCSHKATLP